jgi:hypothetical protein
MLKSYFSEDQPEKHRNSRPVTIETRGSPGGSKRGALYSEMSVESLNIFIDLVAIISAKLWFYDKVLAEKFYPRF